MSLLGTIIVNLFSGFNDISVCEAVSECKLAQVKCILLSMRNNSQLDAYSIMANHF